MKSFEGYLKQTAGDTYLLLAGGGIKPLSDFLTTNSLSNYNPTNNFKTINGNSIIGTGDISISGGNTSDLNKYLLRGNLTQGSWNPRGTNLAVDWNYNGGDLSISETGGQISISIDGMFYQREGQYRCLDTADSPFLGSSYWVGSSTWAWNPFNANQTWLNGYSMRRSDWSGDTGDFRFYLSTSPPGCGGMGICMNIDGYIACLSQIYAGNGFVNGSDISLKKNIKSISSYLPLVEFDWKSDGKHTYGFIAQELVELGYSELVGGIDGRMYVNYDAALTMCLAKLSNIVEQ